MRDPGGERLWNLLARHQEREQDRVGDDVEDHRTHVRRGEEHSWYICEAQIAIDEHRDEESINRADCGRLRRREHAGIDAPEDQEYQQQAPDRVAEGGEPLAPRRALHAWIIIAPGTIPGRRAEHGREHQARYHAGHEQLADRRRAHAMTVRTDDRGAAGRDRIDHHHDRGRDEDAERA